jgi:HEPN superfamily AbiU2-like protein
MKPSPIWDKWVEWLGDLSEPGTIAKDVIDMRAARRVWEGFQTIVGVAPEEARKYGTFHSWLNGNYIRCQGLAVRRQVEVDDDVVSLGRLLDRISKAPSVLSRERYLAQLHPMTPDIGNEYFDSLVGPGADAIDPATPLEHLEALRQKTAKVKKWVDKEVAHYEKNTGQFSQHLTFGDVHQALDAIFEVLNHYCRLLLGTTIAGSISMAPWETVFRVAWIPDEAAWLYVAQTQQETDNRRM